MEHAPWWVVALCAFALGGLITRMCWPRKMVAGEREPASLQALDGLHVAVCLRTPEGTMPRLQCRLEYGLTAHGVLLYQLPPELIRNDLPAACWDWNIAGIPIDVVILGRVDEEEIQDTRTIYPTVQSIHTPTSRRFDELPPDHPEHRRSNEFCPRLFGGSGQDEYVEPFNMYLARREKEKAVMTAMTTYHAMGLRFHGPGWRILGAADGRNKQLDPLADQAIARLAEIAARRQLP